MNLYDHLYTAYCKHLLEVPHSQSEEMLPLKLSLYCSETWRRETGRMASQAGKEGLVTNVASWTRAVGIVESSLVMFPVAARRGSASETAVAVVAP